MLHRRFRNLRHLADLEPIRRMVGLPDMFRRLHTMWQKIIDPDEKVELELSRAEARIAPHGVGVSPPTS